MPKHLWRPRHGQSLMERPVRGWLERRCGFVATNLPKFFLDPRPGILIGAAFTFVGRRELQVRTAGFLLMSIWLIVDLWAWILVKKVDRHHEQLWASSKFAIGWTGTSLLLIGVMATIWWGLSLRVQDQQAEVFQNLTASVELPPTGNPVESFFTIRNGSAVDIANDRVVCRVNFAVYGNGQVQSGTKDFLLGRPKTPLLAGDDAKTDFCSALQMSKNTLSCADVTWEYNYTIVTQPWVWKSKIFRFATFKFGSQFVWHKEPITEVQSPCHTPPPDTSRYTRVTECLHGCTFDDLQVAVDAVNCGTIIYYNRIEWKGLATVHKACTPQNWIIVKGSSDPQTEATLPFNGW